MKFWINLNLIGITLLLCSAMAYGQFTVKGVVQDETGLSLIGASVVVKNTTIGTTTDLDGSFELQVPEDDVTLVISFIGYETQEYQASAAMPEVLITLAEATTQLNEVVIVGYGTSRKEELTGAVTKLQSAKLEQVPLASVEQTLQGNVAGLQAVMGNGQPGSNVQVRIRGIGSITASSEPLYVIDGIPVTAGDITRTNTTANTMASLNPNDIESVTVLKDAAATSIYGSRGSNGVILITTKSGRSGKPRIDLHAQYGVNDWAVSEKKRLKPLTSEQYTQMFIEGWVNRGESVQDAIDRFDGYYPGAVTFNSAGDIQQINVETNWIDEITRKGQNQSYDLSASGGNDFVNYYISGSYFSQDAPIIYSGLDRLSSRVNVTVNASSKLKITNNLFASTLDQRGMSDGSFWANPLYTGYFLAPVIPLKDDQGRYYGDHLFFMGGNNPVGSLSGDDERMFNQLRILDNLSAEYEILKDLKFRTSWAIDRIDVQEFFYRNPRYGDGRNVGGFATETNIGENNWIGTQTLNYSKSLNNIHQFTFLAGYEAQKNQRKGLELSGEGYPNPTLRTLANAATPTQASSDLAEYSFESLFGRVDYNYRLKYYLSGTVRRDGSSRFGINNRFGTFWSLGASWRLDQEDFIAGLSFIDDLKLRASYGTNGNAGIGNYDHIPLFGFGEAYDGVPGGAPSNIGNVDLTWESTNSFNVGLDFGLMNFLYGTVEYFNRESTNLLLDRPISRTTGFDAITQNFGAMRNNGIEITLNADVIRRSDFTLSLGGNITFLKNRITKLDEDIIDVTKIRREGLDFQTFYLYEWAGVNSQDGTPQWFTDSTQTELTGNINNAERFISGRSATPDFFGGLNADIAWKGLYMNAQFSYSWGNYLYDEEARFLQGDGALTPRSQTNLNLARWQNPGDVTEVPYFRWGGNNNSNVGNMTRWLYDGSYLRLRNFTLGYRLPVDIVNKMNVRAANIYLRGTNLWTYTKDKDLYLDPEASINGVVASPVPNIKTITFGLDLGF